MSHQTNSANKILSAGQKKKSLQIYNLTVFPPSTERVSETPSCCNFWLGLFNFLYKSYYAAMSMDLDAPVPIGAQEQVAPTYVDPSFLLQCSRSWQMVLFGPLRTATFTFKK